jgi:hypothetical protein
MRDSKAKVVPDPKDVRPADEHPKAVAYYSALVNSWINTRLDRDKTLVTLSTAGVGILITLLTGRKVVGWPQWCSYSLALAGFILCVMLALHTMRLNSDYIEAILSKSDDEPKPEVDSIAAKLRCLDNAVVSCFIVGLLSSVAFGLLFGVQSNTPKGDNPMVSDEHKKVIQTDDFKKSLSGLHNLEPKVEPSSSGTESTGTQTQSNPGKTDAPTGGDKK